MRESEEVTRGLIKWVYILEWATRIFVVFLVELSVGVRVLSYSVFTIPESQLGHPREQREGLRTAIFVIFQMLY